MFTQTINFETRQLLRSQANRADVFTSVARPTPARCDSFIALKCILVF